ncbi:MAG: argininosuccinate lyase, partial [Bacteroidales bacterium]|nr:argininosuccinate lyase [Bacteroidales bacterium]
MANKLWDKGYDEDARIDAFTVGQDRELDLQLAAYVILGTIAHIYMLESVGLLPVADLEKLLPE